MNACFNAVSGTIADVRGTRTGRDGIRRHRASHASTTTRDTGWDAIVAAFRARVQSPPCPEFAMPPGNSSALQAPFGQTVSRAFRGI